MVDLICQKKSGEALSKAQIDYFVQGYTNGEIPDYQASALLMAIVFMSMTYEETANLTMAMACTGEILDLSEIPGIKVDKHSTGGVGDKTTLVCAPIVAACGGKMAKMSGRGLGHTGGTIDKLESIPGFKTSLTTQEFIYNVNKSGLCITGQTGTIAPADKKMYALRDVTGTVESIPLIASSIMSKKIASGADAIVLDVKVGKGAFMKDITSAKQLAQTMIAIGELVGKKTVAVISDMDEPLGYAIGNSIEVIEAIETSKGNGPKDLTELSYTISSIMLELSGIGDRTTNVSLCKNAITSGLAIKKLSEMINQQGGNPNVINDYSLLGSPKFVFKYKAPKAGTIFSIDSLSIGKAACVLGAGRIKKGDNIDLTVGIKLFKKTGDSILEGDVIAELYSYKDNFDDALNELTSAWHIESDSKPKDLDLIFEVIG